jgi:CelD/BcsL family acetyltransferase involved in cellulose biosynthesis
MPSEISTQVLSWRQWAEFAPTWKSIHHSSFESSIFLCPEWVGCWLETYGPSLQPELVVFRAGSDGQVVGCCLLVWRTRWILGVPLRQVHLNCAGEDLADTTYVEFNSLLSLPGFEKGVAGALAAHLKARRWDMFLMSGMLNSETTSTFSSALGQCDMEAKPAPFVDFAKQRAKGGEFISGLSSNMRTALRRSQRSFEALGGPISVHFALNPDEAIEMFDQMAKLHQAAWTARGMPGSFSSAMFTQFHQQFIRKHFDHMLMIRVQAGAEVLGVLYCLLDQGRLLYYQSGYNYALDPKSSPGKLSNYLVIVECMLRPELTGFDFMAGTVEYKRSMTGGSERPLYWCSIQRKTPASLYYQMLRRLKKRFSRSPEPASAPGAKTPASA